MPAVPFVHSLWHGAGLGWLLWASTFTVTGSALQPSRGFVAVSSIILKNASMCFKGVVVSPCIGILSCLPTALHCPALPLPACFLCAWAVHKPARAAPDPPPAWFSMDSHQCRLALPLPGCHVPRLCVGGPISLPPAWLLGPSCSRSSPATHAARARAMA